MVSHVWQSVTCIVKLHGGGALELHLVYMVLGLAQIWAGSYEKRLPLGKIAEKQI